MYLSRGGVMYSTATAGRLFRSHLSASTSYCKLLSEERLIDIETEKSFALLRLFSTFAEKRNPLLYRTSSVFQSTPTSKKMSKISQTDDKILQDVLELVRREKLLCDAIGNNGDQKVVEFVHPKELETCLGGLEIGTEPTSPEDVKTFMEAVVRYSVKTCHHRFYNQLYHGIDTYGLAGGWLSDALNTNNHTFEVAPVFIVVEKALLRYCMKKFGWNPEEGDGLMAAGGSMSNFYGMVLSRYRVMPESKTKGLFGAKPLVVYTSEESHYSVLKGANWLGLGTENVIKIRTDSSGRMIPEELETAIRKSIDEGKVPMMVNATSGTTVCGAYDDLDAISEVCSKFEPKIWLHVDACWGGAAIFSSKLKGLMSGSEKVDSLAWNAHKMLGAPLQASVFICRHKGMLHHCNSAAASYLFQQDKFYDVNYDTGDMSVQCGRKVDAFKAWFMLKARGDAYFEYLVDNAFERANYLAEQIRSRPGFELVIDPVGCTNVCFTYTPPCLRENHVDPVRLSQVAPLIKEAMIKQGTLMVGYQPLKHKGLGNFFRMVVHCLPESNDAEMDFVLDEIERIGKDLIV